MTRPRFDSHSTQFGLWLRQQKEIDSSFGFTATNIDYAWTNYKIGQWMLIEEKRYGGSVTFAQGAIFKIIDMACRMDKNYHGFHVICFENTSPDDGKIFLDGKEVSKELLIEFLKFQVIMNL